MRTSFLVYVSAFTVCTSLFLACGDDGASSSSTTENLTFTDENGNPIEIEVKTSSFKDSRDGEKYSTVTVDGITWMAENLRYAANGSYDSKDIGAKGDYGRFYSSATAHTVCPDGWHLPTRIEWQKLFSSLEKVYGDSAGWALKSKTGWQSTEDGQSGNGGDVIGFSAEPAGTYKREYEDEGLLAGFWNYAFRNNSHYDEGVHFDYDETTWTFIVYTYGGSSRVVLNVRCVKDENTVFENLGTCTSTSEGKIAAHNGDHLICRDAVWQVPTRDDILNFEFGLCDTTRTDSVHVWNDTAFTCRTTDALFGNNGGTWDIATQEEALGTCDETNLKTLKKYNGEEYACRKVKNKWYEWHVADANDVLPTCYTSRLHTVDYFKNVAYTCKLDYNEFIWQKSSDKEIAKSKLGECTEAKKGEVGTTKVGKYLCVNKYWRPLNIVEENLGACKTNGATGVFDGYTFTCDAKHLLWKATLGGDTALVAVDSALWMTQDSYSGKYVYSPMIQGGSPCPAGFRVTSNKDWDKLYDNLDVNMQLDELMAPDSASYYGLNLYNPYQYGDAESYFLQDGGKCSYIAYGEGTHCQVDTREIMPINYLIPGSVWVCSASESNKSAGICSSGYAAARCIKDFSTPEADEE